MKISNYLFGILTCNLFFLSCAPNNGTRGDDSSTNQIIVKDVDPVVPFLSDSAFCTNLFLNKKTVLSRHLFDWDSKPIISIIENHFSFDSIKKEAHIHGVLNNGQKYYGVKNRKYEFDCHLRDTAFVNYDLELYELAKDCFDKDAKFPAALVEGGEQKTYHHILGQRIYYGSDGKVWGDIIEENETSRTYCTNKRLSSSDVSTFALITDNDDFSIKCFVTKSRPKDPYAVVSLYKTRNRIEILYYPGNTYFILDANTFDIIERDHIN